MEVDADEWYRALPKEVTGYEEFAKVARLVKIRGKAQGFYAGVMPTSSVHF